jgi:hypothetical protein
VDRTTSVVHTNDDDEDSDDDDTGVVEECDSPWSLLGLEGLELNNISDGSSGSALGWLVEVSAVESNNASLLDTRAEVTNVDDLLVLRWHEFIMMDPNMTGGDHDDDDDDGEKDGKCCHRVVDCDDKVFM